MRRPRWVLAVVCAGLAACSGDDSHKLSTLHPAVVGAGGSAVVDGGSGSGSAVLTGAVAPLTESMAMPYFQTGDAGDGMRAFALEKWADAQAAFTRARTTAKGDDVARIELLIGLSAERQSLWPQAAEHLVAARKGLPLIADYIAYHAARSLYFARDFAKARELVQQISRDSIVGAEGELLAGDLVRAAGDPAQVIAHYRDYLARHPNGPRRSESRFFLAEALEKTAGDVREYVDLYRKITIEDPLASWAPRAQERLDAIAKTALAKQLPASFATQRSAAEHITRGKELFEAMRNPESEAAFDAALAAPGITVADRCVAAYHKAQSRFKARDRKGAAPMFDAAAVACKAAKNADLEIKCLYQAGRSYAYLGEHEVATQKYQAAQLIDPTHSYSDDAMLREAEEWTSRGDAKQVEAVLSALPTKFPSGDNLAEAMWRLGWAAWKVKQYDDAIKWWTKQIELVPHDDNYFGEGQAQYWLGRAYAAKGKQAEAIASWELAVRSYPAAYYALLAFNRLRETDPKKYEALVAEVSADPKGFDPKAPAFVFKPRVEWGAPGFQRALEFLKLGLGQSAAAELDKLGLAAPGDKKRVDDPDKIEKLWAMAFLFDRAGRYGSSHWPTRWHILDYRRQWPVGTNRARWLIAYPRAYEELLARHAATNKVPFAMQIAIVREESAFDPLLESYANAIGLTQMIPPTAKDFAKGTGIDPTRENLRDPEMNVTIGSRFLGFLFAQFKNFTVLVPPGYNAGPAGTRRMLRARGTLGSDEFVETIVDDQARNYTKRVLGTFFTYSWLYEKKVPEMPNAIPTDLIPK
ncbi:MAG: Lytic transglycosylase catalytic [Deltaproteobacteria bacterium]|nr:Lytic transglycosylase catalytic [Deltaproteobacteria bacterium]